MGLSLESSLLRNLSQDSSLAALPLRTKDVDIPYFVQNFRLALLAYGIGSHASCPHIHELLLHADTVLQAYTFVESLERKMFDEQIMPSICMLLTFAPNSTDFVSLPLTMGRT